MRILPAAALLVTCLLGVQMAGQADGPHHQAQGQAPSQAKGQAQPKPPAPAHQAPRDVATNATKGIVKTVSASAIVITRTSAGKRTETSFVVNASTQRVGTVAAGATVEIRYRTDGKQRIATVISVEASPQ